VRAQALRSFVSLWEDSLHEYETEDRAMSLERLRSSELFRTHEVWHENPEDIRSGFCACAKPKANCRLERAVWDEERGQQHWGLYHVLNLYSILLWNIHLDKLHQLHFLEICKWLQPIRLHNLLDSRSHLLQEKLQHKLRQFVYFRQ